MNFLNIMGYLSYSFPVSSVKMSDDKKLTTKNLNIFSISFPVLDLLFVFIHNILQASGQLVSTLVMKVKIF